MKLSRLIEQADDIYELKLGRSAKQELQRRLVSAGFRQTVTDASKAIDAILQTSDHLSGRRQMATAALAYSDMKRESVATHDGCPRCHQRMQRIELVDARQADYCQSCAIALPVKA